MSKIIKKITDCVKNHFWLIFVLLSTSFLRFYHIDYQSIWLDEVLSMIDTNPEMNFHQFYQSVLVFEAFPHLYFLLLKWFMCVFGYSTFSARVFSAIIGVLGVYAIYLLGKEIYNKRVGLFAATITSVSIYHITYSQEVRPYGMLFLFTVLSFYRMIIFIKTPNYKNAVYYGFFSALIINSHFFGLLTILSQFVTIIYFIFITPLQNRKRFFLRSLVAGLVLILLTLPTYEPLFQITQIKSFWILNPSLDAFSQMFKEFFGNSELLLFVIYNIIIFYLIELFKQKTKNNLAAGIIENKVIFSFVILFPWIIISILIPIIKSYLDVSMILTRYFINILPVFIITVAIGLELINNKFVKNSVFLCLIIFSMIDLFIIKNYYNKPSKCQMRELTNEIKARNNDNTKLVVFYSWVFPYFFKDRPDIPIEGNSLEDYIKGMKNNSINKTDFWFASVNPYDLKPEYEEYLKQNFIQKEKLEYFDAWAYHFVSKNERKVDLKSNIDLKIFKRIALDEKGNINLLENINSISSYFDLDKGNYKLCVKGNSFPSPAINNENAHIKIKLNGNEIANFYLSDNIATPEKTFPFSNLNYDKVRLQLIYDNDVLIKGKDRNAKIYSIKMIKKIN